MAAHQPPTHLTPILLCRRLCSLGNEGREILLSRSGEESEDRRARIAGGGKAVSAPPFYMRGFFQSSLQVLSVSALHLSQGAAECPFSRHPVCSHHQGHSLSEIGRW